MKDKLPPKSSSNRDPSRRNAILEEDIIQARERIQAREAEVKS
jgi:hypothetical protein